MFSGFPYGASYSPLIFSEREWEKDLAKMQSAGMNLVRIGDVHGSWDRIEPRPGEMQLDRLDQFYISAQRFGVHILLSTGASSPPLWLARQYPDISILSSRGECYPLGASYHWACVNHTGFRLAAESYLERLANFAISHGNHFGWQISNEIGFPFMPAREQNDLGLYCYCKFCQDGFRTWLKKKYKTLEALTEAWSWSTTNFVYNAWEDISAPESTPESWSGVTRWLDWRLFMQSSFASFTGWQHAIIRKIDFDHPTSVNTFNFKGFDRFGTFMGLDQWQIAERTDHIGYDLYPGSGDKLKSRPEHNSIFLDHGRSVAKSVGGDFWAHEVESGPIGGWVMGPDHDTDEQDVLNNAIECLGHDVKLVLYMPWREWGYQPLRWGALVDLDGNPTPRFEAVMALGKTVQDQADFLMTSHVPQAEVAILESKSNAIFFRGVNQEEMLFAAQRGVYRAFWEQGLGVDFISTRNLTQEILQKYRIVCLPMFGLMSEELAFELETFVFNGGILIGFARCATLSDRGWYHHQLPIRGLQAVFGIQTVHAGNLDVKTIQFKDQSFIGNMNRDQLILNFDTEILASFSDGLPAVTLNYHGKGMGMYLATQADSGSLRPQGDLLTQVIVEISRRAGIQPMMGFIGDVPRTDGIDAHLLENGNKSMVLFSNYSPTDLSVTFWLQAGSREVDDAYQIFPNRLDLNSVKKSEVVHISLEFKAKEVKVIEINWQ